MATELVPNNKKRIEVLITERGKPVTDRIVKVRVAASATSMGPIGTMSYTAAADPDQPNLYVVEIPGADIAQAALVYGYRPAVIQVVEGTDLSGYLDAVFVPVRRL